MKSKVWLGGGGVILCAIVLAGCASAPARADAPAAYAPAAAPSAIASASTTASNLAAVSDPRAAFVDGYRAYLQHDNPRAIEWLKFAADNFLALGDYAL